MEISAIWITVCHLWFFIFFLLKVEHTLLQPCTLCQSYCRVNGIGLSRAGFSPGNQSRWWVQPCFVCHLTGTECVTQKLNVSDLGDQLIWSEVLSLLFIFFFRSLVASSFVHLFHLPHDHKVSIKNTTQGSACYPHSQRSSSTQHHTLTCAGTAQLQLVCISLSVLVNVISTFL